MVRRSKRDTLAYIIGIACSAAAHFFCALLAIYIFHRNAAIANRPQEIFSVTLEGGEKLGGITQVPKQDPKFLRPPPDFAKGAEESLPEKSSVAKKGSDKETSREEKERTEATHKLTAPAVVDDPQKIAAEKKAAEEKKKKEEELKLKKEQEEKKKKEDEEKKKAAEEKTRKEEQEEKEQLAAEKLRKEKEKRDFNRRLSQITSNLKARYDGESVNAGGEGFGAASLGGKGMGGGILAPAEKIAYANELQQYVKSAWHWMPSSGRLRAYVSVKIEMDGRILNIRVEESSGNAQFDDSVVRAIEKASPVPKPPTEYYADFSNVGFWFDSQEQ